MSFAQLAIYLDRLEKTASRNEITAILADLFKKLKADEAGQAVYLSLGQLAPSYADLELNIAEKLMIKIMALAYEKSEKEIHSLFKNRGDFGAIAESLANKAEAEPLTITQVYNKLIEIAQFEGKGSVDKKITHFARLLKQLDPLSARFVVRIPLAKLRLGFSSLTILDALSVMTQGNKSLRSEIERAYNVSADIGHIVEVFKQKGMKGLKKIAITPGTPIRMAAAERLPNAQKIIEKIGKCAVEPKYDGFRVQIHILKRPKTSNNFRHVILFSRNLENTTDMFPDIAKAAERLGVESAILEGEAVGYNPATNEFLPFQETMQRKRKHDIDLFAEKLPLKVFAFDVLYLNGKTLLHKPHRERRKILEKTLPPPHSDELIVTTRSDITDKPEKIEKLFDEYVAEGLEGVVVKKLDAPYQAGARGYHWIKFKRAMRGELADTIDAVVMGYYHGRGKRTEFGIGAFLVGVYDGQNTSFKTIAKIGTGLTDEEWREMKKRADKVRTGIKPNQYELVKNLKPDVWVKPAIVVEVQADEITKSPIHTAAQDKNGVGLALRFPRLLKFRDDKSPEQATTVLELLKLFRMQKSRR